MNTIILILLALVVYGGIAALFFHLFVRTLIKEVKRSATVVHLDPKEISVLKDVGLVTEGGRA